MGSKIHELVKNWMGANFTSAKSVIVSDTPSRLVGRYLQSYKYYGNPRSFFNRITVDIKDEKIKCTVDNIEAEAGGSISLPVNEKCLIDASESIHRMYLSMVEYVNNPEW